MTEVGTNDGPVWVELRRSRVVERRPAAFDQPG